MAKQTTELASESGKHVAWVAQEVTIDMDGKRLQFPKVVRQIVPWLATLPVECLILRGGQGGVLLVSLAGPLGILYRETEASISNDPPLDIHFSLEKTKLLRWFAGARQTSIVANGEHARFYIPTELKEDGLELFKGRKLWCFAAGNILELWAPAEWDSMTKEVASDQHNIVNRPN